MGSGAAGPSGSRAEPSPWLDRFGGSDAEFGEEAAGVVDQDVDRAVGGDGFLDEA